MKEIASWYKLMCLVLAHDKCSNYLQSVHYSILRPALRFLELSFGRGGFVKLAVLRSCFLKKSFVVMLLENILTFNTIAKALGVPSAHLLSLLFIVLTPGNVWISDEASLARWRLQPCWDNSRGKYLYLLHVHFVMSLHRAIPKSTSELQLGFPPCLLSPNYF